MKYQVRVIWYLTCLSCAMLNVAAPGYALGVALSQRVAIWRDLYEAVGRNYVKHCSALEI